MSEVRNSFLESMTPQVRDQLSQTTQQRIGRGLTDEDLKSIDDNLNQLQQASQGRRLPDFHLPRPDVKEGFDKVMGYKIFGKSVGDLTKEAAVSGSLGALFRIGLGTAGFGGIALGAGVGASVNGSREYFKQVNNTWVRLKTENGGNINKRDRLKGLYNPDHKRSIAFAIGRGAIFGAAGGMIGEKVAETGLGEAIKATAGPLREFLGNVGRWRESWALPDGVAETAQNVGKALGGAQPGLENKIEHSQYFTADVLIKDDSPQWIKSINSSDGTYGHAIQGTVGKYLLEIQPSLDEKVRQFGSHYVQWLEAEDHIKHIVERHANEAFDSHLQKLVESGVDLNSISDADFQEMIDKVGKEAFDKWTKENANTEITNAMQDLFSVKQEIAALVTDPQVAPTKVDIAKGTDLFKIMNPQNITDKEILKETAPDLIASIAVHQDALVHSTYMDGVKEGKYGGVVRIPDFYFPADFGDLSSLLRRAEEGDEEALSRIMKAWKVIAADKFELKILTPEGRNRILAILNKLG